MTEVARLTREDQLQNGILDIPEKIIPGPTANLRCCIYKERAIVAEVTSRASRALSPHRFRNPIVGDPLWERVAERLALLERAKKVVDAGYTYFERFGDYHSAHSQCVVLCNDVFVV